MTYKIFLIFKFFVGINIIVAFPEPVIFWQSLQ